MVVDVSKLMFSHLLVDFSQTKIFTEFLKIIFNAGGSSLLLISPVEFVMKKHPRPVHPDKHRGE